MSAGRFELNCTIACVIPFLNQGRYNGEILRVGVGKVLRVGKTLLRVGRTLLRVGKTLLRVGKTLLRVGKTLLRVGKFCASGKLF